MRGIRVVSVSALLVLAACGAVPSSPAVNDSTPSGPVTVPMTARTALHAFLGGVYVPPPAGEQWRLVSVDAPSATGGKAAPWMIAAVAINANKRVTVRVDSPTAVTLVDEAAYNPALGGYGTPFTLDALTLDTDGVMRLLPAERSLRGLFLDADDAGQLRWLVKFDGGGQERIPAGTTNVETPSPPSDIIRRPPRN